MNSSRHARLSRHFLLISVAAVCLAACTHSDYMPNVIQLTPDGTATNPVPEPVTQSFTLIAVEDGYTGNFTAQTVAGKCWVVSSPVTTSGAWTVVPQGVTCNQDDVEQIKVTDTNGHAALTYIHSVGHVASP